MLTEVAHVVQTNPDSAFRRHDTRLHTAVGATAAPEQARLRLLGQWEWVSSEGGFAGGTYGPADWGYTWQLSFLDDGTVIDFRDGVEVARSVFMIEDSYGNDILTVEDSDPMVEPFGTAIGTV